MAEPFPNVSSNLDFGPKRITVNAIAPGGVKTDMYVEAARKYIPGEENMSDEQINEVCRDCSRKSPFRVTDAYGADGSPFFSTEEGRLSRGRLSRGGIPVQRGWWMDEWAGAYYRWWCRNVMSIA